MSEYTTVYLKFESEEQFDNYCRDAEGNLISWIIWTTPLRHFVSHDEQPEEGFHCGGWVAAEYTSNLEALQAFILYPASPSVLLQ